MSEPRRFLVKVDYLQCRSKLEPLEVLAVLADLCAWTGYRLEMRPGKGMHGYRQGAELLLGGLEGARIGRMDWGGDQMADWLMVDIGGQGCGYLDWGRIDKLAAVSQLRRCDPCVTFYDGSVTHDTVIEAFNAGGLTGRAGGRPPACRVLQAIGDPWCGRTVYVGSRGGFKMLRAYDKGLEVLSSEKRKPGPDVDPSTVLVDGWPARDVYRIEVEFRAQGRVPLPWAMASEPLGYWRGAYPWLASLLPGLAVPLAVPQKVQALAEVDAMLATIKHQYGAIIFTACAAHGGDIGAVFSKICGHQHSERLLRAGALLGCDDPADDVTVTKRPHDNFVT
jgi:DNA relaxase NicK